MKRRGSFLLSIGELLCLDFCINYGTLPSVDKNQNDPILDVVFYRTEAGNEPVREWLKELPREDRRTIEQLVKILKLCSMAGLWECR